MTKESWGGEGLFGLHVLITVHQEGKAEQEVKKGRNLETGTEAKIMEECCLLACSSWLTQHDFLYTPGHPEWAGPFHRHHSVEKIQQRYALRPVWWKHFLISLFLNDLSLCQVDQKNKKTETPGQSVRASFSLIQGHRAREDTRNASLPSFPGDPNSVPFTAFFFFY